MNSFISMLSEKRSQEVTNGHKYFYEILTAEIIARHSCCTDLNVKSK